MHESLLPCWLPVQLSEEIKFGREDDDEVKVKAMEFFAPIGEQVRACAHAFLYVCVHVCLCGCVDESMHMGAGPR